MKEIVWDKRQRWVLLTSEQDISPMMLQEKADEYMTMKMIRWRFHLVDCGLKELNGKNIWQASSDGV